MDQFESFERNDEGFDGILGVGDSLPDGLGTDEALEATDDLGRKRRKRGSNIGTVGLTYYVFEPGTNLYSSYRVFGVQSTELSLTN